MPSIVRKKARSVIPERAFYLCYLDDAFLDDAFLDDVFLDDVFWSPLEVAAAQITTPNAILFTKSAKL